MISDAVLAVVQVVFTICLCASMSRSIPNAPKVARDISTLVSHLFLPSLTFYNVVISFSDELLAQCSVLFLFALLVVGLGVTLAKVTSPFLFKVNNTGVPKDLQSSIRLVLSNPNADEGTENDQESVAHVLSVVVSGDIEARRVEAREVLTYLSPPEEEYEKQPFYCCALLLALCVQNAVTIPLSLLQALSETLTWVDLETGTAYVFMYSIIVTCVLWGVGPVLVKKAKGETDRRHTIRKLLELQTKLQGCREAATQTEVDCRTSRLASPSLPPGMLSQRPAAAEGAVDETLAGTEEARAAAVNNSNEDSMGRAEGGTEWPNATLGGKNIILSETPSVCHTFACDLLHTGQIRVISIGEFIREENEAKANASRFLGAMVWLKKTLTQLLSTPSFTSVFLGVFVSFIPPIKNLFVGGVLFPVLEVIYILSKGSIPCSLFLLGSNFMNNNAAVLTPRIVRLRDAEQNTEFPLDDISADQETMERYNDDHEHITFDAHSSFTPSHLLNGNTEMHPSDASMASASAVPASSARTSGEGFRNTLKNMFSLQGVRRSFMIGVIILRLLVMPALGYTAFFALRYLLPGLFNGGKSHDVLLLVLLGQLASPSAINCNILFTSEQYMPHVWAKMLLYQYVCCIVTLAVWYSLSIHLAE
uniref:Putative transporter n=1 Tax=Trypanosoma congolense (strain IL3000) TaxID=1068625 RepID=G0USF3_TRYCI|nr:putative transporter [Trypanosoma congolense IL3000]